MIDPDPLYIDLGKNDSERRKNYLKWINESIPPEEWNTIRRAINKGGVFGGDGFKAKIEKVMGRTFDMRGRGRPKKEKGEK